MISNIVEALNAVSESWLNFMTQQVLFSTVIFIVIFATTLLLRRKSVWLHFFLWGIVFLRLILVISDRYSCKQ